MHHPRPVCIVTHHKTGTVWMRRVFSAVAEATGIPFVSPQHKTWAEHVARAQAGAPVMLFLPGGVLLPELANARELTFIHMIRDPRDVLLSGLAYHRSHVATPQSPETALHRPRDAFGGLSYQQKLLSLPSERKQLEFEMRRRHNTTVRQMLNWDYTTPRSIEWRYENMMQDVDGSRFRRALAEIGHGAAACAQLTACFLENSLFGAKADGNGNTSHVTSGKLQRWVTELPMSFRPRYDERYGDALRSLGYETDGRWVHRTAD